MSLEQPSLSDVALVCAADGGYFGLLSGLVRSIRADPTARRMALSVLDLGLEPGQIAWLAGQGATVRAPDWDLDFPGRARFPRWFRAMTARPFLPRHFPGHAVYLWIDSDAWVQDGSVLTHYVAAARLGKLAIVPELDRAYFNHYRRPKLLGWDQNHKAMAFAYGLAAANRLGRYPILNSGVFALAAEAPHWALWAEALERALNRRRLGRLSTDRLMVKIIEQTALNSVVFADWKAPTRRAPATFLPAWANWLCGKATPMFDPAGGHLVEPHAPHRPLGVVHLAGAGVQSRTFRLSTPDGGAVETMLTFEAVEALRSD